MKKEKGARGRGGGLVVVVHGEQHRMQDRVGSTQSETTYFPNANHSGECGNMKLTSLEILRSLINSLETRSGEPEELMIQNWTQDMLVYRLCREVLISDSLLFLFLK